MKQENTVTLPPRVVAFWTGGFDSTFRILQVALIEKRIVQPIYIDTGERRSTPHEIAAMDRIRAEVTKHYGDEAAARILPTRYDTLDGVGDAPDIANIYKEIDEVYGLGIQYKWLANYMRDRSLDHVEMGMHWIERDRDMPCHWIKPNSVFRNGVWKISDNPADTRIIELFGRFHFPILTLTKANMRAQAEKDDLMRVLKFVHFCHRPRSDGSACGRCSPCKTTASEGLADMLPLSTRYFYKLVPLRRFVRRATGF